MTWLQAQLTQATSSTTNSCLPHPPAPGGSVMLSLFYTALLIFAVWEMSWPFAWPIKRTRRSTRQMSSWSTWQCPTSCSPDPARKDHLLLAGLQLAFRGRGFCRLTAFIFFVNLSGIYLMTCVSVDAWPWSAPWCPRLREPGWAQLILCGCVGPGSAADSAPARVHHDHAPGWQADLHGVRQRPSRCSRCRHGPGDLRSELLRAGGRHPLLLREDHCQAVQDGGTQPLTRSRRGHHRRACLLTLVVLVAVFLSSSPTTSTSSVHGDKDAPPAPPAPRAEGFQTVPAAHRLPHELEL